MLRVGFAFALVAAALMPAAPAAADGIDPNGPFGPLAGYTFDPLTPAEPEPVPQVQQPDTTRLPLFNTYFGSNLYDPSTGRYASVTTGPDAAGNPRVYVASSSTNRVYVFDGKLTLSPPTPPQPLFTFGTQAGPATLQGAAGISYYRGELYVVDRYRANPGQDRVVVYDSAGNYRREFPLINPRGLLDMSGVDVAGNEVWVTGELCGGFGGVVEIFDAPTGAIKGVVPNLAHAPTGDLTKPCDETADPSAWWDLALAPELNAAIAQYRLIDRGLLAQLSIPDAELTCETCFRRLWQDGTDAVWGMRWFMSVDGDSASARGTGVTEFSIDPAAVEGQFLQERRRWAPMQATSGGVRDVAYQNRETRIDWDGNLTRPDWQHNDASGHQCLNYVVSDADIFAVGQKGEHWWELARNFQKIEFYVDGSLKQTFTSPSGQYCFDELTVPSGVHDLVSKAYVNDGSKVVTIENDQLHVDHDPPHGSMDSLAPYVTGTVTVSGQMGDDHSGPRDWQQQVAPSGGSWQDVCGRQAQPDSSSKFRCDWDTTRGADGAYDLRGSMRDMVEDPFGGPNTAATPSVGTNVDNTPPALQVSGPLRSPPGALSDPTTATIAAQDAGSGVVGIEVDVDGTQRYSDAQGCAGGCSMTRDFQFNPDDYSDGAHTVRVVARDALGHASEDSWQVTVEQAPEDRLFDAQFESVGPPDTASEAPGPDDEESPDSYAAPDHGAGYDTTCAADDEWGESLVPTYMQPQPGSPPLSVTPQSALVKLMASDTMPLVPPTAFQMEQQASDYAVFVARLGGQIRAFVVVELHDGLGWIGTYYEGCSKFPEELATSQLPPTGAGTGTPTLTR